MRSIGSRPGGSLNSLLTQITGRELEAGQLGLPHGELADPSPPYEGATGLRIYGTGAYFLEFDSWEDLLSGSKSRRGAVELFHPDGTQILDHQGAWDLLVHRWPGENPLSSEEVMYAGVMTPTGDRKSARWPEDNWNRRIYAFRKIAQDKWMRVREPLFGARADETFSWLDHSYGHHFVECESGSTWIFYEKVIEEMPDTFGNLVPFRTEIFAREMKNAFVASPIEMPILGVGLPPYPSTRRMHPVTAQPNGYLVEGPRPCRFTDRGETFYLMGFSSGDFATDHYTLNAAWSRSVAGPYVPFLEEQNGRVDFADFGRDFKTQLDLSWGPARPAFFSDPGGQLWVLFHAVDKKILPRDYARWPQEPLTNFHRNVYLAPVSIGRDGEGALTIAIEGLATERLVEVGQST